MILQIHVQDLFWWDNIRNKLYYLYIKFSLYSSFNMNHSTIYIKKYFLYDMLKMQQTSTLIFTCVCQYVFDLLFLLKLKLYNSYI